MLLQIPISEPCSMMENQIALHIPDIWRKTRKETWVHQVLLWVLPYIKLYNHYVLHWLGACRQLQYSCTTQHGNLQEKVHHISVIWHIVLQPKLKAAAQKHGFPTITISTRNTPIIFQNQCPCVQTKPNQWLRKRPWFLIKTSAPNFALEIEIVMPNSTRYDHL